MAPLSTDISKVAKKTPGHIPYAPPRSPSGKAITASEGKEGWRLQGPGSPVPNGGTGDPADFKRHYFTDKDDWAAVAKKAGYSDPLELIRLNFETTDSREVNWFLQHYCGCNRTSDMLNFAFSNSAAIPKGGGFVWVPVKKGLPYPPKPSSKKMDCSIVKMTTKMVKSHKFGKKETLAIGGGSVVKVGMVIPTALGDRLLLSVSVTVVVFTYVSVNDKKNKSKIGQLFKQNGNCAVIDLKYGFASRVAKSGKWLQKAAKWEAALIAGMLAGPGLAAGFKIVEAVTDGKFEQDIALAKALVVINNELANIKSVSPELYNLVVRCFFDGFDEKLSEADGQTIWKFAGTLISDFGSDALQGRIDTTKVVTSLLKVFKDALKDKTGKALDKAVEDYLKDVPEMIAGFHAAGVSLTRKQAETIAEQVKKNPEKIKRSLDKIDTALKSIKLKYRKSK